MNKQIKMLLTIIFGIVAITVAVVLIFVFKERQKKEENKLYSTMNTVVKDYYRDYYYVYILGDDDETRAKNASNYPNGISLTLRELAKYKVNNEDSILSQFKNYRTGANCNYDKTKIVIYPVEPYGREDIRIDANIVCGF